MSPLRRTRSVNGVRDVVVVCQFEFFTRRQRGKQQRDFVGKTGDLHW